VPYADAADFFAGRRRWLSWEPERMHRPKDAGLFEPDKLVLQRLRGRGSTRVAIDRTGLYVGHTCTVVVPHAGAPALEALERLVASDLVAGLLRVERGAALDLYPHAVAAMPVPKSWLNGEPAPLAVSWGLDVDEVRRLESLAATR
jgi:hypothetical protein